jgi:hypothetical protein
MVMVIVVVVMMMMMMAIMLIMMVLRLSDIVMLSFHFSFIVPNNLVQSVAH